LSALDVFDPLQILNLLRELQEGSARRLSSSA